MDPAPSARSAGQKAFSNAKRMSNFIGTVQLAAHTCGTSTKAAGSNSLTENSRMARNDRLSPTQTFASGAYSANNCLQAPHGIGPPGAPATTAMAAKPLFPAVTALNNATPSAQQVSP